jgi:hypothetical protein
MIKISSILSLLIVNLAPQMLASSLAMEHTFPIDIINSSREEKTRLTGIFTYNDGTVKEFDIVVRGITAHAPSTLTQQTLPIGIIDSFEFYLTNYHEKHHQGDLAETHIASLKYKPDPITVKGILITLKNDTIVPKITFSPLTELDNKKAKD